MESQGLVASGTNEDVRTCTTACTEASAASTKDVFSASPDSVEGEAEKCRVTGAFAGEECANDALWISLQMGGGGANHPPAIRPAAKIPHPNKKGEHASDVVVMAWLFCLLVANKSTLPLCESHAAFRQQI
jgi:hypothetical protein